MVVVVVAVVVGVVVVVVAGRVVVLGVGVVFVYRPKKIQHNASKFWAAILCFSTCHLQVPFLFHL